MAEPIPDGDGDTNTPYEPASGRKVPASGKNKMLVSCNG
jgi:hypothetical protein